jgi:hypothetical protein
MVNKGSLWQSMDGRRFQVISEVKVEDNMWVHYRRIDSEYDEPKEFSCYTESFLSRFTKLPEN